MLPIPHDSRDYVVLPATANNMLNLDIESLILILSQCR